MKNDDGFLVPDPIKIDNYAKSVARKYGLPEDGVFKEVVYNEATTMAAFKELEPEINKRFSELITIYPSGSDLFKEKTKEFWKGFTTDEVEQIELEKKVDLIASDLKVKSKQEQDVLESNLKNVVSNLDNSIKQSQEQISLEYQKVEQAYKSGQIDFKEYQSSFNALKQQSDEAYKAYSDERLKTDIKKIGSFDNGLNIYSYHYKDGYDLPEGKQVGVMAQEVEKIIPEAVVEMPNGFKGVNYAMLGV
jgi:hypothetical protein